MIYGVFSWLWNRNSNFLQQKDYSSICSLSHNLVAGTECEVANTSTTVFVITDKTLRAVEKLVDNLKKLGIKDVDGELAYNEEEAGYEYLQ